jgi:dTDP-glucose 4,6-dehydratase
LAIVVARGAGFLGSHLVDRLARDNGHVAIYDDLTDGRLANVERALCTGRVTFVYLDEPFPSRLIVRATGGERLTAVYHIGAAAVDPLPLLELAIEHAATFVYVATPLDADEAPVSAEHVVAAAIAQRGADARIVRVFEPYGPRMDLRARHPLAGLFAAVRDGAPLRLDPSWDETVAPTFVDDAIDGILSVAAADGIGSIVELGAAREHEVVHVASHLSASTGIPLVPPTHPPLRRAPRRADTTRARALGWRPQVPLHEGLARTRAWATTEMPLYA